MIEIEKMGVANLTIAISVTEEDYEVGWKPSKGRINNASFYKMTINRNYEATLANGHRYGRNMMSVGVVSGLNKGIIQFTATIDGVSQIKEIEFEFYYDKLAPIPSITNINSNEIYSTYGLFLEATMESYYWDYYDGLYLQINNVKVYIDGESVEIFRIETDVPNRRIKIEISFPQGVHTISVEVINPYNNLSGVSEAIEFTVSNGSQFNYLPDRYQTLSYDLVFDFELIDVFDIVGPVSIILSRVVGITQEVILDIKLEKNINNRYFYIFHNIYGYNIQIDAFATNSVGVTSEAKSFITFSVNNQNVLPIFNRTKIIEE